MSYVSHIIKEQDLLQMICKIAAQLNNTKFDIKGNCENVLPKASSVIQ